jgi:acetoin utilization deacetylase AcuC-like enzyme
MKALRDRSVYYSLSACGNDPATQDDGGRVKTGWVWDEAYAWHHTGVGAGYLPVGGWIQPALPIYESPESKTRFRSLAEVSGLLSHTVPLAAREATDEELLRFHTEHYLRHLKQLSDGGGGEAGEGSPMGPHSYEIARRSAGGALVAVEAVVTGAVDNAYALVRPPGHHAERSRARGFCFLANTALAALHARHALGLERVAIVDWDVHHGNGTEDAFYRDDTVLTISMHADQLYPIGRGLLTDNGEGRGRGTNINIPLPDGSGHGAYLAAVEDVVLPALRRFQPDLVLIASGFDASSFDPLGRQLLTSESYRSMTASLLEAAGELCGGRVVAIHEGGYSEAYVPFCGVAVLETLCGVRIVDDPFLAAVEHRPGQSLQAHQRAVIDQAVALVEQVPSPAGQVADTAVNQLV